MITKVMFDGRRLKKSEIYQSLQSLYAFRRYTIAPIRCYTYSELASIFYDALYRRFQGSIPFEYTFVKS